MTNKSFRHLLYNCSPCILLSVNLGLTHSIEFNGKKRRCYQRCIQNLDDKFSPKLVPILFLPHSTSFFPFIIYLVYHYNFSPFSCHTRIHPNRPPLCSRLLETLNVVQSRDVIATTSGSCFRSKRAYPRRNPSTNNEDMSQNVENGVRNGIGLQVSDT